DPDGRFKVYIATGGPGHLDPRQNDGVSWWAQGVEESASWEAPLFHLFDAIHSHPKARLISICHSFGLMCRSSGVAKPVLRDASETRLREREEASGSPSQSEYDGPSRPRY